MRTSFDIPDEVYRNLKIMAAREGRPLREIVLRGIERELSSVAVQPVRKLTLPLIPSSRPGSLDLTNEQIDDILALP